jgi:hypothetical protein
MQRGSTDSANSDGFEVWVKLDRKSPQIGRILVFAGRWEEQPFGG